MTAHPSACVDPVVGEGLLDRARPRDGAGPRLEPGDYAHLEICASCRASVEALRRLVGAWQALEPSPRELRAARTRFLLGARKRASTKVVPKAAALVVVLAAAAASAAVRVVAVRLAAPPVPVAAATEEPVQSVPRKAKHGAWHGVRASDAHDAGTAIEATDEAVDVAPVEAPAPVAVPAEVSINQLPVVAPPPPVLPPVAPARIVTAAAPHVVAPAAVPAEGRPSPSPEPPPAASARPSSWVVAAAAMRSGDYAGAEAAFTDLACSSDPASRDAARLARAQVWIAQGRTVDARPELEGLASGGATALIRKRAANALAGLP